MPWRRAQSGTVVTVFIAAAIIAVVIQWSVFSFQAETQEVDAEIPTEEEAGNVKLSAAVSQALRSDMGSGYARRNLYTVISYVLSTESDNIYIRREAISVQEARDDIESLLSQRLSNSLLVETRSVKYRMNIKPETSVQPISVGNYNPSGGGTVYQQQIQLSDGSRATINLFTRGKKSGKGLYP
jgi:hypothetical protein